MTTALLGEGSQIQSAGLARKQEPPTRGIDEALQTISELELRRRFRVDPAEGPAIDLQEEGFNL